MKKVPSPQAGQETISMWRYKHRNSPGSRFQINHSNYEESKLQHIQHIQPLYIWTGTLCPTAVHTLQDGRVFVKAQSYGELPKTTVAKSKAEGRDRF